MECSICMEIIHNTNDSITTSCNHTFHGSCLMTNTWYNGYACPCCRTVLVKESVCKIANDNDDDDDDDDEDDYDDDTSDDDTTVFLDDDTILYDNEDLEEEMLQNFRWFFQRANGEELDGDEESYNLQVEEEKESEAEREIIWTDDKKTIETLMTHVKKTNSLSYDDLLTAFISLNYREHRYNEFGNVCAKRVLRTVHQINERNKSTTT